MSKKNKTIDININNDDENEISQSEIDKLIGIEANSAKYNTVNKAEWVHCIYCEKIHHKDYYAPNMTYCIHCWAWLNGHEYDLESGVYIGIHSQNDVNKVIKKGYNVHCKSKCENSECLFNKIKKYNDLKLLHVSLVTLLELNKQPKQKAVGFNYKNKNLNVNFNDSYIVI